MNMNKTLMTTIALPCMALALLSGCSDSDDDNDLVCEPPLVANADGTACVAPQGELVELGDNQVALYYHDLSATENSAYDGWVLHLWNGDSCPSAYSQQMIDKDGDHFNNWADGYPPDGYSDEYGAYWVLDVNADASCANFVIHNGDDKGTGSADMALDLTQSSHYAFTFKNSSKIYYDALTTPPVVIDGAAAHWLDASTLVWNVTADHVELLASADASIAIDDEGNLTGTYNTYPLATATLSTETAAAFPHLASYTAFSIAQDASAVKTILKDQLVAVAYDADGNVLDATQVQQAGVLDALYTSGSDDADEATLGATMADGNTTFNLWAPTAQQVELLAFDANKTALDGYPAAMTEDAATGIWSLSTDLPAGTYYQYQLTVYHPLTGELETVVTTDPYSLSLSVNSDYSQVVDLNSADLKPAGWDAQTAPIVAPKDIVIYEAHVRDFSASDASVSAEHRGKYLAFTDTSSVPVQHLQQLQQAGVTHFHLLPVFDIASINEDPAQRVALTDTVGKLCQLNANASVCSSANSGDTIEQLLTACDPATQCAETIMDDVRDLDAFNWGYDPYHFGVPEGSYATNAEGTTRIVEFRQMVEALHNIGLDVVMDVVYNHTNAAGVSDTSVLDKVVPGYYQRLDVNSGQVLNSTCCSNTATEHRMMGKLMIDTLKTWATEYKIDAFRFDLMGEQPLALMQEALADLRNDNPNMYFYGEGWNLGDGVEQRFVPAQQAYLGGTGIGSFSDRMRDAVRGGSPFDSGDGIRRTQGIANGLYNFPNELNSGSADEKASLLTATDIARVELAGNLKDFVLVDHTDAVTHGKDVDYNGQAAGYAESPIEIESYVSKHDNQTLWDNNQYKIPTGTSMADRVRMQDFALSFPLLGQSIPFIQMGSELLRSKSMERDSYNSGDWYNNVDFTANSNNWNVGLPRDDKDADNYDVIKAVTADTSTVAAPSDISTSNQRFLEFLRLRSSSPLFRLGAKEAVMQRVDYHNTGADQIPGVIVMSIDDGTSAGADLDTNYDGIVTVFNASADSVTVNLPVAGLELNAIQRNSSDSEINSITVSGTQVSVPGFSTIVLVLPEQNSVQGSGIPVLAKDTGNVPPYGDTQVLLRGSMNNWETDTALTFMGNGVYQVTMNLTAADYEFKFADADWGDVNLGYSNIVVGSDSLPLGDNDGNITVTIDQDGSYTFTLDASDTSAPVASITSAD